LAIPILSGNGPLLYSDTPAEYIIFTFSNPSFQ